jgi:hypothetical protein
MAGRRAHRLVDVQEKPYIEVYADKKDELVRPHKQDIIMLHTSSALLLRTCTCESLRFHMPDTRGGCVLHAMDR